MLPVSLKLDGLRVLVLGAGAVGAAKAARLLEAGARVTVLSDDVRVDLPTGVERVIRRPYQAGDLAGYALVVSAVGSATVNVEVVAEARERGQWINVVDDLERSSFYFSALVRRGAVSVAVSTEGASPALAQELRDRVETMMPSHVARVAEVLRAERDAIHAAGASTEGRSWRERVCQLLDEE